MAEQKNKKVLVIVDAGHGGLHPDTQKYMTFPWDGKKYDFWRNGNFTATSYEGVFNRQIADRLKLLAEKEENVLIEFVHHSYLDKSLNDRAALANVIVEKNPDEVCVFISIHCNASSNLALGEGGQGRGFEIYTTKGTTKADKLASVIYNNLKEKFEGDLFFRPDFSDGDADKEEQFYVLWATNCPAVLLECAFFDNWNDYQFLLKEETVFGFAEAILQAIKEFDK